MKCTICQKDATHYWKKSSGRIELCFEHYEEMERELHQRERIKFMFNFVGNGVMEIEKCANGNGCKYCLEIKQS